jgi:amino-acid N-acetyltransferase
VAHQPEPARPHDVESALALLRLAKLPEEGVVEQFGHFLVVRIHGQVVGTVGIERHGADGLLRSLVVAPDYRGDGVGGSLVGGALDLAKKLELRNVYLLTTTAQPFFERHGFGVAGREQAPALIRESWEFRQGCPTTAAFMKRTLVLG